MGARITELLASSQAAGEQGNVDGAQAAAAQADAVKVNLDAIAPLCLLSIVKFRTLCDCAIVLSIRVCL